MIDWTWVDRLVEALESGVDMSPDQFRRSIELARRKAANEEREACAKWADDHVTADHNRDWQECARSIAAAIRARGGL